jgi:hypothetical protein
VDATLVSRLRSRASGVALESATKDGLFAAFTVRRGALHRVSNGTMHARNFHMQKSRLPKNIAPLVLRTAQIAPLKAEIACQRPTRVLPFFEN